MVSIHTAFDLHLLFFVMLHDSQNLLRVQGHKLWATAQLDGHAQPLRGVATAWAQQFASWKMQGDDYVYI